MSKRGSSAPLECKWTGCPQNGSLFTSREELSFHVNDSHLAECSSQDLFFCLWEGCKVYNRPSYSFEWLKRHIKEKHTKERLNKCLMNGCNKSFNTTEALQRHLQRHFDRTPSPPPPLPRPIATLKANKLSKNNSSQSSLSDIDLASSLSCSQSADEEYLTEEGFGDVEDESDDSYIPGSQSTTASSKQRRSFKIKISRKQLGVQQPHSDHHPPMAFNGAHFHREDLVDMKAMNVIRQTANELAGHDIEQNMDSNITVRPQVLGKRRCPFESEEECLIRWYPRLLPDEWIGVSGFIRERIIPFSELTPYQLSILSTNCLSNELSVYPRRSKRKP